MKDMSYHHSLCDCTSVEHTVHWQFDPEQKEVYFSVFLKNYRSFFKRVWIAVKYVFGYKSAYGHFDCYLLNKKEASKLINAIQDALEL